jgi:hypothetical protein
MGGSRSACAAARAARDPRVQVGRPWSPDPTCRPPAGRSDPGRCHLRHHGTPAARPVLFRDRGLNHGARAAGDRTGHPRARGEAPQGVRRNAAQAAGPRPPRVSAGPARTSTPLGHEPTWAAAAGPRPPGGGAPGEGLNAVSCRAREATPILSTAERASPRRPPRRRHRILDRSPLARPSKIAAPSGRGKNRPMAHSSRRRTTGRSSPPLGVRERDRLGHIGLPLAQGAPQRQQRPGVPPPAEQETRPAPAGDLVADRVLDRSATKGLPAEPPGDLRADASALAARPLDDEGRAQPTRPTCSRRSGRQPASCRGAVHHPGEAAAVRRSA